MKLPPFPRWCMTSLYFFLTRLFEFSIDWLQSLLLSSLFDLRTLSLPSSTTLLFQPSTSSCDEQEKSLITLFPTCVSVLLDSVSNLFVLLPRQLDISQKMYLQIFLKLWELGMGSQSSLDMPWIFIVPVLFHMFRMLHTIR